MGQGSLTRAGEDIKLQAKTLSVLKLFIERPGEILSRQEIKDAVWAGDSVVDNSVDQRVADLRRAFEKYDPESNYIETRPKQGWRFTASVQIPLIEPDLEERPTPPGEGVDPGNVPFEDRPIPETLPIQRLPTEAGEVSGLAARPPSELSGIPRGRTAARARHVSFLPVLLLAGAALASAAAGLWYFQPRGAKVSGPIDVQITGITQLTADGHLKQGPLCTDGQYVYFIESRHQAMDAERAEAAVDLRSPATVVFPWMPAPHLYLISTVQSAARLYFDWESGGHLFLQRERQGPISLLPIEKPGSGQLSPDGAWIAIARRSVFEVGKTAGRDLWKIELPGLAGPPMWRPDGKVFWTVVVDPVTKISSLWEIDRETRLPTRLPFAFPAGTHVGSGAWTKDGLTLVFAEAEERGAKSSIWTISSNGLGGWLAPVSHSSSVNLDSPTVAYDDSGFFAIGTRFYDDVVRFDAGRGKFLPFWPGIPAADVAFSHNGKFAAYVLYPELTLWISNADGSGRRQITHSPFMASQPHWSPDDAEISFMAQMPTQKFRDYTVPAAGGDFHEITPDYPLEQGPATWSAEGRYMVFGELQSRRGRSAMEIHLLELAHGAVTTLSGSAGKWSPRWSPDGRQILATSSDMESLWLFDWARKQWRMLAEVHNIDSAEWSPDSKFVQFSASPGGNFGIYRAWIESGDVRRIADLPLDDAYVSASVAPDGSAITNHQVRSDEIYRVDWKRSTPARGR